MTDESSEETFPSKDRYHIARFRPLILEEDTQSTPEGVASF